MQSPSSRAHVPSSRRVRVDVGQSSGCLVLTPALSGARLALTVQVSTNVASSASVRGLQVSGTLRAGPPGVVQRYELCAVWADSLIGAITAVQPVTLVGHVGAGTLAALEAARGGYPLVVALCLPRVTWVDGVWASPIREVAEDVVFELSADEWRGQIEKIGAGAGGDADADIDAATNLRRVLNRVHQTYRDAAQVEAEHTHETLPLPTRRRRGDQPKT